MILNEKPCSHCMHSTHLSLFVLIILPLSDYIKTVGYICKWISLTPCTFCNMVIERSFYEKLSDISKRVMNVISVCKYPIYTSNLFSPNISDFNHWIFFDNSCLSWFQILSLLCSKVWCIIAGVFVFSRKTGLNAVIAFTGI